MLCAWCDAEAVYERRYLRKKNRPKWMGEHRFLYACVQHAKNLKEVNPGYGYAIARVDAKNITPDEMYNVFDVASKNRLLL